MADTGKAYLKGGPCDGRFVSTDQIVGGAVAYIACGGGFYIVDDGATHKGADVVFKYAGKTQPGPPGGSGGTPHTHKGWNDVRTSFNKHMPPALNASQKDSGAALRALAKARRVRL